MNTNAKIEIKTRLHPGINSKYAGVVHTWRHWNAGPINLLRAVRELERVSRENELCYGNVGCGISWIEIDRIPLESVFWMDGPLLPQARELLMSYLDGSEVQYRAEGLGHHYAGDALGYEDARDEICADDITDPDSRAAALAEDIRESVGSRHYQVALTIAIETYNSRIRRAAAKSAA